MRLTKSKQFLADAIHASGKGWPDEASWAAQDKTDGRCEENRICFFSGPDKPVCIGAPKAWRCGTHESTFMGYCHSVKCDKRSPNWHQTILSREEYFFLYQEHGLEASLDEPMADADGWIEWKGGECPIYGDLVVSIKVRGEDGSARGIASHWGWGHTGDGSDIIAYRLHKPVDKSTAVGEDETNLAAKEELEALERSESPEQRAKLAEIYKPSIEQLAADYRNAKDYAERKQQEAYEAKAAADAAFCDLARAGEDLGLVIGIAKQVNGNA